MATDSPLAARRRDPRREATARALIEAAESLFGQAGVDGVSTRQIGAAIGSANTNVVAYHFGAKDALIEGGVTTQPEFSFWFEDVGWQVENYGTDPDIDVEIAPQDHVAGRDVQLDRAIAEGLQLLTDRPVRRPDPATRPSRALPKLPPRV